MNCDFIELLCLILHRCLLSLAVHCGPFRVGSRWRSRPLPCFYTRLRAFSYREGYVSYVAGQICAALSIYASQTIDYHAELVANRTEKATLALASAALLARSRHVRSLNRNGRRNLAVRFRGRHPLRTSPEQEAASGRLLVSIEGYCRPAESSARRWAEFGARDCPPRDCVSSIYSTTTHFARIACMLLSSMQSLAACKMSER